MKLYREWLFRHLLTVMFAIIVIGIINFILDPFWCFEHRNSFNNWQKATNERQQKANKLYFSSTRYDTLLLGSSRTTFLKQSDFTHQKVFNFSASAMRPEEYLPYIDFSINDAKQPIKTIIIGLDFFGCLTNESFHNINPTQIVEATKSPHYRWKTLISYDATNNSVRNIRNTFNQNYQNMTYDRNNIHRLFKKADTKLNVSNMKKDIEGYAHNEYANSPDPQFFSIMSTLQQKYHHKNIIIYTTPISKPLFEKMVQMGHYPHYEEWLKNLVKIYGTVHHFMYINPITEHYNEHFIDSNHAYPQTNTLIAKRITSKYESNQSNFGMILTHENIQTKLQELRSLNGIKK